MRGAVKIILVLRDKHPRLSFGTIARDPASVEPEVLGEFGGWGGVDGRWWIVVMIASGDRVSYVEVVVLLGCGGLATHDTSRGVWSAIRYN